jgi:murein DD-endopeptidase MepM/ murein hydrolase activator NlpD
MPDYRLATERAARKFGVNPAILKALIKRESNFNPNARSSAGARDIAQFMPPTAKAYGVTLGDGLVTDDLEGAARYIADNLKRTGGNYHQALSIYNSGRPDAYKDPSFAGGQTYNYVRSILADAKKEGPAVNGGRSSSSSRSHPSSSTTTTTTVGGVDNSGARRAATLSFLQDKKSDPLDFAMQIRGMQDVPGQTVTTKTNGSAGRTGSTADPSSRASGRNPTGKRGKVIGTPYSGTHTLGNWQSDNAVDIAVPVGTPLIALQDGVVVKVKHHPQNGGRFAGDQVTVRGANGNMYFYGHGSETDVKPGQRVRKGQRIGKSGAANGVAHLHFGQERGDPRMHTR